jgi:hypothetical protein
MVLVSRQPPTYPPAYRINRFGFLPQLSGGRSTFSYQVVDLPSAIRWSIYLQLSGGRSTSAIRWSIPTSAIRWSIPTSAIRWSIPTFDYQVVDLPQLSGGRFLPSTIRWSIYLQLPSATFDYQVVDPYRQLSGDRFLPSTIRWSIYLQLPSATFSSFGICSKNSKAPPVTH